MQERSQGPAASSGTVARKPSDAGKAMKRASDKDNLAPGESKADIKPIVKVEKEQSPPDHKMSAENSSDARTSGNSRRQIPKRKAVEESAESSPRRARPRRSISVPPRRQQEASGRARGNSQEGRGNQAVGQSRHGHASVANLNQHRYRKSFNLFFCL